MLVKIKNKWITLGAYALVAALSQFLWLNFAPIISLIEKKYSVREATASLLILVFPLIYVFLSIPTGILIDNKGYRFTVGWGALMMAVFSVLRIFDSRFETLLIAQVGIAIAQPFVINGITKLVMDWFEPRQAALATGLGTVGMFLGMALGLALTPSLVKSYGLSHTMGVFALVSVLLCVAFFLFVYPNKNNTQSKSVHIQYQFWPEFITLLKNKNVMLLFTLSFLGLGYFNGLTTWIEPILAPQGVDSVQAGIVGAILIIGGIFGAGVVPAISDLFKKRKVFLVMCILLTSLTLIPMCFGNKIDYIYTLSALQGFTFLPAFSLLLEMCTELAGENVAGFATSILMLMGNAGGVVVVLAMEFVKGERFRSAVYLLEGIMLASLMISFLIPETYKIKVIKRL